VTASNTTPFPTGTIAGYPRIGAHRELKKLLEAYWKGSIDRAAFDAGAAELRAHNRRHLVALGLGATDSSIPSDASYYDHMADMTLMLGAIPHRFESRRAHDGSLDLDAYFAIARGDAENPPLEMTKWFDTNYHYLVPEIGPQTPISLSSRRVVELFLEAKNDGFVTRPALVGPVTYLALSKASESAPEGFDPLSRLDDVVQVYAEILGELAGAGAEWVQLDESAVVSENLGIDVDKIHAALRHAYIGLTRVNTPRLFVLTSYGTIPNDALNVLASLEVDAIGVDLVKGDVPQPAVSLSNTTLVGGVIDGHNIWRGNLGAAFGKLESLRGLGAAAVAASTSTSLFHVPHSLEGENHLSAELRSWLAFADEKVGQVVTLAKGLTAGREEIAADIAAAAAALEDRASANGVRVDAVRQRTSALSPADFTRGDAQERHDLQAKRFNLPPLPTTTIGSFPQTNEIRVARAKFAKGELTEAQYEDEMKAEIERVVRLQEDLDIDVLVHGEPERNDMVQYFAEQLNGFDVTVNGWVQSYGSRCTRPSILWGDVSRRGAMTVDWSTFTQSLTKRPVKGMLTGPVTIMAWSFVRDDVPLAETANQLGLALRDEVSDLEAAGIGIIQVDEPALRELLPLKQKDHAQYLEWSVGSFRLATSGVRAETQIHTHLCYSEFGQIIDAIDGLAADVTSIEAARSRMDVVDDIARSGFDRGVGPGVWDIHSPRVPSADEQTALIERALEGVRTELLWVNPDCGLKTRGYNETVQSLKNLVEATKRVRATL
jgi:5-methyltetrahydropteroyltriglutamate--homocysteine methyltransferase